MDSSNRKTVYLLWQWNYNFDERYDTLLGVYEQEESAVSEKTKTAEEYPPSYELGYYITKEEVK